LRSVDGSTLGDDVCDDAAGGFAGLARAMEPPGIGRFSSFRACASADVSSFAAAASVAPPPATAAGAAGATAETGPVTALLSVPLTPLPVDVVADAGPPLRWMFAHTGFDFTGDVDRARPPSSTFTFVADSGAATAVADVAMSGGCGGGCAAAGAGADKTTDVVTDSRPSAPLDTTGGGRSAIADDIEPEAM
jgi:hypothetical protein